ncbi:hypothetical protein L210DRAFT_978455 [Boletus edulis BED1]|uniref:Uncharacterized protein n=1 Tax=Boletus edulis BED1 TaxID=1328754 RepID=A0AAD4C0R3_BOLED|nr:hypothetical protein L210DRAFT_978455 [Boletus edulis BED1]
MHNLRFNMCGLGIPLGKDEPHVPQAAHHLAKAILDDLEEADKKNKGKQKARGTPDEAEEVGRKTKRMRGSTKMKDKVEAEIRVKTQKLARKKRPPVEEDRSASDSEMVVEDSRGAEYELDDEDAITLQAINTEEKQDDGGRSEDDIITEQSDEMENYQRMQAFCEMILWETGTTQVFNSQWIVEASKDGGGDDDDSTSTTDAALKHKRVSSIESTLSEQGITLKKNKCPSPTQNPLLSVTIEALLTLPNDIGSSCIGTGLECHAMEGKITL